MPGNNTYFISDMHLGAAYIADPKAHERRIASWLDKIGPDAARLYMLGDVMDYWWDYRTVVPRGHTRFLGALARLADAGVAITWFKGNHDIWLTDYMQTEIGLTVVDGSLVTDIDGKRFFLEHGDGVGERPLPFRLLRQLFRCRVAQKAYSAIHPRWTIPLAHAWSRHSRESDMTPVGDDTEAVTAPLIDFAQNYLTAHPDIDYFVFGHVHRLLERPLAPGKKVVILGDWITQFTYAKFDGKELTLHRYE